MSDETSKTEKSTSAVEIDPPLVDKTATSKEMESITNNESNQLQKEREEEASLNTETTQNDNDASVAVANAIGHDYPVAVRIIDSSQLGRSDCVKPISCSAVETKTNINENVISSGLLMPREKSNYANILSVNDEIPMDHQAKAMNSMESFYHASQLKMRIEIPDKTVTEEYDQRKGTDEVPADVVHPTKCEGKHAHLVTHDTKQDGLLDSNRSLKESPKEVTEYVNIYILNPTSGLPPSIDNVSTVAPKKNSDDTTFHQFSKCILKYSVGTTAGKMSSRAEKLEHLKRECLKKFLLLKPINKNRLRSADRMKSRIEYVSSLWPDVIVTKPHEDMRDILGIEVVVAEETKVVTPSNRVVTPQEMLTRRSDSNAYAFHPGSHPVTPRSEDVWAQCDDCQKWRRLPDHVDVSRLPTRWFCSMNQWDKERNKCSVEEERVSVPMKEAEWQELRQKTYVKQFLVRLKTMEKMLAECKAPDPKKDDKKRKVVQCSECFKFRSLLSGLDPMKISRPFVCWMNNWDELHASCSAPQEMIVASSSHLDGNNNEKTAGPSTNLKKGESTSVTKSKLSGKTNALSADFIGMSSGKIGAKTKLVGQSAGAKKRVRSSGIIDKAKKPRR